MKIKIVGRPYMDYEIGDVVDFGEEKNASLVEFQRAVWVEEETKKKVTKTTTQTEEDANEDSSPTRGADGRFTSKKKTEEPKKKGSSG